MDASKIMVLVLILATVALLVWVEMKSRKNTRSAEEAPTIPPPPVEQRNSRKRR